MSTSAPTYILFLPCILTFILTSKLVFVITINIVNHLFIFFSYCSFLPISLSCVWIISLLHEKYSILVSFYENLLLNLLGLKESLLSFLKSCFWGKAEYRILFAVIVFKRIYHSTDIWFPYFLLVS